MSEEKKIECVECICHKEWLRQLLVVCFGTFAGVYLALGLDHFVNRPPVIVPISYYSLEAPAPAPMQCDKAKKPMKPNKQLKKEFRK